MTRNVKKQALCAFVIKIDKCDDVADANLNMIDESNVIKTNVNLEKRNDFVIVFEFVVIASFEILDVIKDVIDKSI